MDDAELKEIKGLPDYKTVLETLLKRQMRQLADELSTLLGEESLIVTVNTTDGTSSHISSRYGRGFMDDKDYIKTEFRNHCIKNFKDEVEKENIGEDGSPTNMHRLEGGYCKRSEGDKLAGETSSNILDSVAVNKPGRVRKASESLTDCSPVKQMRQNASAAKLNKTAQFNDMNTNICDNESEVKEEPIVDDAGTDEMYHTGPSTVTGTHLLEGKSEPVGISGRCGDGEDVSDDGVMEDGLVDPTDTLMDSDGGQGKPEGLSSNTGGRTCYTAVTTATDDCHGHTDPMATTSCEGRPRSTSIDRVLCYLKERQRLKESMNICKPNPLMNTNTRSCMEGKEVNEDTGAICKSFTLAKDKGWMDTMDIGQTSQEQELQTASKCSDSLGRSIRKVSACIRMEKETGFLKLKEKTDSMKVPVIIAQNQAILMQSGSKCSDNSEPIKAVQNVVTGTNNLEETSFPDCKEKADSKKVPVIVVQKPDSSIECIYSKPREVLIEIPASSITNSTGSSPSIRTIHCRDMSLDNRTGATQTESEPHFISNEGNVIIVKRVFDKETPEFVVTSLTKDVINDNNSDCINERPRSCYTDKENTNQQLVNMDDEEPSKLVIDFDRKQESTKRSSNYCLSFDNSSLVESENAPNPGHGDLFVSKQDLVYMDATALEYEKMRHEMSNLKPWHPIQYWYYPSKLRNQLIGEINTGVRRESTGSSGSIDLNVRNNEYFMLMLYKQRFMSMKIPGGVDTCEYLIRDLKQKMEDDANRHFLEVEWRENPEKVKEIRAFFKKIYRYDFLKEISKEYVIKEPYKTIIFDEEVYIESTSKGMKLIRPFIVYRLSSCFGRDQRNFCPLCDGGKELSSNSKLNNHLDLHTGLKLFKCFVCSKRFMRKQGLTDHARQHTITQN